ncbi:MAG: hypothetical protein NVSMB51_22490 [Solirubrobacteraceae bacterium]
MIELRLYRTALIPLLLAVLVAAFSLGGRARPLATTLAPDAFDGPTAFNDIGALARQYPDRRPGSAGDLALAAFMHDDFAAATGFTVSTVDRTADTVAGSRTVRDVIATRPGESNHSLVLVAHRDAARPGSLAELSGTAALLELVHVFSGRVTHRTLTLVSTSGGSGGAAGAAQLARALPGPVDAVIVLGDLAGAHTRRPQVIPWSDAANGTAPVRLRRTVEASLQAELARSPGGLAVSDQFARIALPLSTGEQGPLLAAGVPAVLVQGSGEVGPGAADAVSEPRMQALGRGVLRAVTALDSGPDIGAGPSRDLLIGSRTLGAWTIRLLTAALLLPALLCTVDLLARLRRRREPLGQWLVWVLGWAVPFALTGLFAVMLGRFELLSAAPRGPVSAVQLPIDGPGRAGLISTALVFGICWLARHGVLRSVGRPRGWAGAAGALSGLIGMLAVLVWLRNPFAAALLVAPLHLWLLATALDPPPRRWPGIAAVLAATLPAVALLALDASRLELGPLDAAWTTLLLAAGGHSGVLSIAAWSMSAGGLLAALAIVVQRARERPAEPEVTMRGPLSYAGPGSLGGTESALRR